MGSLESGAEAVRFYLFGAPRLEKAGRPVAVDTRKALALLAYLVLGERGTQAGHSRDSLAALFYPEADGSSARAALRRTLSTLRKAVDSGCLLTEGERVALKSGCVWVDVLSFRELLRAIGEHGHPAAEVCRECLPLLEACVSLADRSFMAGFSLRDSPEFDDWQAYQAEGLRQELALALEKLSLGLAAEDRFEPAVRYARRWLTLDPLHEAAHRQLMRLYAWKGQRSAALRQYQKCVQILEMELGVPPLEETQRLHRELLENQVPQRPALAEHSPGAGEAITFVPLPGVPSKGLSHGRGSEYPLVGRGREAGALLEAYEKSAEQGYFFILEGEAGIGKSRLASELIRQARARGAAVLQARGYEGQAGLAYAPFVDALNASFASGEAARRLGAISPAALSLAAQLAPALADLFPDLPAASAVEGPGVQVRFFDALRQVIRALLVSPGPTPRPGILFLDDLHWADQASLDLIAYLARRLEGIFLLGTWRSGSAPPDHPLRRLLVQREREGRGASLHLERLGRQEVAELLQALPVNLPDGDPAGILERVYQETEGNPFFLVEYLDALLQNRAEGGSPDWGLPPGVRGLLQAHLDSAGELGRQILSAAAVAGRSFDYAILRAVSGRSELETVEGLEALLQQGLVVEQAPGGEGDSGQGSATLRFDFSHEKLRSLVYEGTSQVRRRLLHQRCGDAFAGLARQQKEAAALAAGHYQKAGQPLQAAAWFQQAGAYARSVFANREAIAHFQTALALGHPDSCSLHEELGDLHTLSGNYAAALESYQAAANACSPELRPGIEHKLGQAYDQRGEWDQAEHFYRQALEHLGAGSSSTGGNRPGHFLQMALVYADWSRSAYRRGETNRARDLASQALRLAEAGPPGPALAQTHNNLGILARAAGQYDEAIQHLERSLEIAQGLEDEGRQAAALNNLARVYAESGQVDEAIRLTGQALAICQQRGDRHREAALHNNLADLYHSLGQEEAAMQHLRQSVVIMADIGGEPGGEQQPEIWKLVEW